MTPWAEDRCCVIINIALTGWDPAILETELFNTFKIHVTAVRWENLKGVRITVQVYTQVQEISKLIAALRELNSREQPDSPDIP